jgi:hypothetical protein
VNKLEVWLHFTKVEPIDPENPKAICNYCNRILGCHWRNGTSTMRVYIFNCPASPLRKSDISKGQTLLQQSFKKMSEGTSSNSNTNQLGFVKNDPIKVRKLIVQYFIKEELHFGHAESDGFRELMNGIERMFNLSCRITLQKDCMKLYEKEKLNLEAFLRGKRIFITTDTKHLFKI